MANTSRLAIVSVALTILSAPAFATKVADLVGSTENGADGKLYKRGFVLVDGKQSGDESFKTYYNSNTHQCVMVEIMDNKVISINPTQGGNCNPTGGPANATAATSGGESSAAGIVAGVAAVGLIAALASHHKKDSSRNTAEYNGQYERGYHDAMYGGQYDSNDSEAYHSGYMAGEVERNNRRHANSALVRGAPAAAQYACKARGDKVWDLPEGSTVPVSVFDYGQGNYEVTVASGYRRGNCSVNASGVISEFLPQ